MNQTTLTVAIISIFALGLLGEWIRRLLDWKRCLSNSLGTAIKFLEDGVPEQIDRSNAIMALRVTLADARTSTFREINTLP